MRGVRVFVLASAAALWACTPTTDLSHYEPAETSRVQSSHGSAVVLSHDERVAVVTNRSAGKLSVFSLTPGAPLDQLAPREACAPEGGAGAVCTELDLGADSEPWVVVLGKDDDTAYVVLRKAQLVRRILNLHTAPTLDALSVQVGSEPTAIAIAPSGRRLFVANWGEGTISVITTSPFARQGELDLNEPLTRLPDLAALLARPALAHPRALVITDDGDDDDDDETLYATEFFSQPLWQKEDPNDSSQFDRNRQGVVYSLRLGRSGVSLITLQPIRDTGFADSNGKATGCFPNQLYAAAADAQRVFVTAVCASPAGPIGPIVTTAGAPDNTNNFKTLSHPVVFVIERATNQELPGERLILTQRLEQLYADDEANGLIRARRMPLIPNDIALLPAGPSAPPRACVTALGADALFCFQRESEAWTVGSAGARYVDLRPKGGRLPIGVALSSSLAGQEFALVANDGTQTLSVVDRSTSAVSQARPTNNDGTDKSAAPKQGRGFFATGLGIWSFKGQAWSSCESCHPDGLSDGVSWFFPRGPRRTLSTAPTFTRSSTGALEQRILLWTGSVDEVHDVEGIVRSVAGGAGAVLRDYGISESPSNDLRISYDSALTEEACSAGAAASPIPKCTPTLLNNLNGSLAALVQDPTTPIKDWEAIEAYLASVRTPRPPSGLDPARVARGRDQFDKGRCAGCHAGPAWTLSRRFYAPGEWATGKLPYSSKGVTRESLQLSLGALRTTAYTVVDSLHRKLNPPAAVAGDGSATLRRWLPPPDADPVPSPDPLIQYAYDKKTALEDQINCVLRDVGTFPAAAGMHGVGKPDAPELREVRQDMTTLALGNTGFNIPSLLGLATGAPYFHAGNARSLEELFDPLFAAHYQALSPEFLKDGATRLEQIQDLVSFLLSLDDDTVARQPEPGDDFCPAELHAP